MQQLRATVSKDPAVFYWLDDCCNVMGVLACHVDDFIWGGSETSHPSLESCFSSWTSRTQQLQLHWNGGSLFGG